MGQNRPPRLSDGAFKDPNEMKAPVAEADSYIERKGDPGEVADPRRMGIDDTQRQESVDAEGEKKFTG